MAIGQHRQRDIDRFAAHHRLVANLDPQRVEEHDRIHPLKRPALPGRHLRHDAVGDRADQIRGHLDAIHFREKALDFAHRHAARIQSKDLVVEAGEAPFVFADQPGLERAFAIARHVQTERAIIGQHRLAAGPIAMIGVVVRPLATRRVAEVMRQLAAQCALDDRLLEPANGRVELLRRNRALAHELVENLVGDGR